MVVPTEDEDAISGINVVPLVDVVLVLLIIFMATAPLIEKRALSVNVPRAAHSEPKATRTLNVVVNAGGQILLGGRVVSLEELGYQISAMARSDPLLHVAVQADELISYGNVVEVLDVIRGASVKKLALEVRPKKRQ